MDFFRSVGGDAAAAAAGQLGGFVNDVTSGTGFQMPQQFNGFQMPQQFQQQQQQPQPDTGPPPASRAALRQLPTISVSAEDLVEPSNRECCICFEEHNIGDKVVRLPCAHIYHSECITDWLQRHCTCPTCRYELPTENPMYEAGRRERMSHRKPRYAKYELERMSIRELKNLLPRRNSSSSMYSDKSDLIDYLISNQVVDLISAPPPVEFPNRAVLRAMGVGQLKRTMNDTGVYFDPKDVVEKEDMVQIFCNSGRILLVDAEDEIASNDTSGYGHAPSSRQRAYSYDPAKDDDEGDEDEDSSGSKEEDDQNEPSSNDNNPRGRSVIVETVGENDDASPTRAERPKRTIPDREAWDSEFVLQEATSRPTEEETRSQQTNEEEGSASEADGDDGTEVVLEEDNNATVQMEAESEPPTELDEHLDVTMEDVEEDLPPAAAASALENAEDVSQAAGGAFTVEDVEDIPPAAAGASVLEDVEEVPPAAAAVHIQDESETDWLDESEVPRKRERETTEAEEAPPENPYQRLSVSQLRALGREGGVDLSNCLEKAEMIERISSANNQQSNEVTAADLARAVDLIQGWSASQLQTCSKAVEIDLSHTTNRDDIVRLLTEAVEKSPHVVKMVLALGPFMSMSIKSLRLQARQWGVKVDDCLEKGEFICRLAAASVQRGY